jgi:hypothetical protein
MKGNDFKALTITQIRWWVWAAAVLPITALAGIFFVWAVAPSSWVGFAIVTGQITMFAVAVTWWWWAMYTLRNLVRQLDDAETKVITVLQDIRQIKDIVKDTITPLNDK